VPDSTRHSAESVPAKGAAQQPQAAAQQQEPQAAAQQQLGLTPRRRDRSRTDSFWAVVGGEPTFRKIVSRFYELVAADDLLRPMYPEEDLGPAEDRLRTFLEQYWGGPTTYQEQRGHPRLRMRHAPYRVTPRARDRWLAHMRVAVREADLAPMHEATLWDYLERAAHFMINSHDDDEGSER